MKVIVNKKASEERKKVLVKKIMDRAEDAALDGKTTFVFRTGPEMMNGITDLYKAVTEASEGTVNAKSDSIVSMHFTIKR